MRNKRKPKDYETVERPRRDRSIVAEDDQDFRPNRRVVKHKPEPGVSTVKTVGPGAMLDVEPTRVTKFRSSTPAESWICKRGHTLSFAGLFVFTFLVYFRPYELFPSLSWLSKSAFIVALITVVVFVPTQLGLENKITATPREVKLVFVLLITGVLSIPFAVAPSRAFQSFTEYLKVIVVFVIMVNVVRTEKRLTKLIVLVLVASCVLSIGALNDYRLGNLVLQGRRIAGVIGGLFSNPNDLALHLVTMIPLSLAMMLGSRSLLKKGLYLACSLLLMAGMVATFSRGGFLGFVCVMGFLVWKLAPRNRMFFGALGLAAVLATIAIAPSAYRSRLATTNDASAVARTDDLKRSILVAARHPAFGVGMDNYIIYSNVNKTTHNAYTQVAAEMGVVALLVYVAFLVTPFRQLKRIEQTALTIKRKPPVYYLAIGLQASLVAYMVVSFFASVAYLWYAYYLVAYCVCLRRVFADSLADKSHSQERTFLETLTAPNRSAIQSRSTIVLGGR